MDGDVARFLLLGVNMALDNVPSGAKTLQNLICHFTGRVHAFELVGYPSMTYIW